MNDINKKLESLLTGTDTTKIKQLAQSNEIKKLFGALSESDKKQLIGKFLNTDTAVLKEKLKKSDISSLSGLNAETLNKILKG